MGSSEAKELCFWYISYELHIGMYTDVHFNHLFGPISCSPSNFAKTGGTKYFVWTGLKGASMVRELPIYDSGQSMHSTSAFRPYGNMYG
jgi:hypothetical protein